jgi:hypothetical protein
MALKKCSALPSGSALIMFLPLNTPRRMRKIRYSTVLYVISPCLEVLQVLGPLAKSSEAASQHYTNHPALKPYFPSAKNSRKFAPHPGCNEENLVDYNGSCHVPLYFADDLVNKFWHKGS